MSVLSTQFGLIGGKFLPIIDSDDYAERQYNESLAKAATHEEYREEVKEALVDKRIVDQFEVEKVMNLLESLKTFKDLDEFVLKVPLALSAQVRANLSSFLKANLNMLGADYPLDEEALYTFIEILIDEKENLIKIGTGGEGVVYKSERLPSSRLKQDERVASPSCLDKGVRHAHFVAIKLLLKGDYKKEHPELVASLQRPPGVLPISCVRELSILAKEPKIGLVMKMGLRSTRASIRLEKTLQGKLAILLQIAHSVAALHKSDRVHMDLKFDNVLQMKDGAVKLIDTSFSQVVGQKAPQNPMTLIYSSPPESINVLMTKQNMTVEAFFDMWSFGIMQYEILMDGLPDLGSGMAFIFSVMQGSYMEKIFPEKAIDVLKRNLDSLFVSLITKTKAASLSDAIDLMLKKEMYAHIFQDYDSGKDKFISIIQKPHNQISIEDLEKAKAFLGQMPDGFISDYNNELHHIKITLHDISLRLKMETYPQLIEINKRLLSFKSAERGDINQYILELSQFLIEHRN